MASRGSGFRLAVPLAYFRNFHISPRQVFRLRVHGVNLLRFASIASGPGCGRLAQGEPNLHVQSNRPRNPEAITKQGTRTRSESQALFLAGSRLRPSLASGVSVKMLI